MQPDARGLPAARPDWLRIKVLSRRARALEPFERDVAFRIREREELFLLRASRTVRALAAKAGNCLQPLLEVLGQRRRELLPLRAGDACAPWRLRAIDAQRRHRTAYYQQ
jgi:hypothetical protein